MRTASRLRGTRWKPTLETVRIAFVDVPRLLRDISIATLARDGRVTVYADDIARAALPKVVAAGRVDVLVAGPQLADAAEICRLLASHPRLKALVVLDEGRRAAFYELRANCDTQELSTDTVVRVVQAACRRCEDELGDG
jgi:hypothetical protein